MTLHGNCDVELYKTGSVWTVPAGLNLVESYPYEPEERGSDYVRLASIAAGEWDICSFVILKNYSGYFSPQKNKVDPTEVKW